MLIYTNDLCWFKGTEYTTNYGNNAISYESEGVRCHVKEEIRRIGDINSHSLILIKSIIVTTKQQNFNIELDRIYDFDSGILYKIQQKAPITTKMLKNYVRLWCEETKWK